MDEEVHSYTLMTNLESHDIQDRQSGEGLQLSPSENMFEKGAPEK